MRMRKGNALASTESASRPKRRAAVAAVEKAGRCLQIEKATIEEACYGMPITVRQPQPFYVGQRVMARYGFDAAAVRKPTRFYPGVVRAVHTAPGESACYDIEYDDGDREVGVRADLVRDVSGDADKRVCAAAVPWQLPSLYQSAPKEKSTVPQPLTREEASAAGPPLLKRPPGRAPGGKQWDPRAGWVPVEAAEEVAEEESAEEEAAEAEADAEPMNSEGEGCDLGSTRQDTTTAL